MWVTVLQLWSNSTMQSEATKAKVNDLTLAVSLLSRFSRVAFSRRMSQAKLTILKGLMSQLHPLILDRFPTIAKRAKTHIFFAHFLPSLHHYTCFVGSAEASESLNAKMRASYLSGNHKNTSADVANSVAAHLTATALLHNAVSKSEEGSGGLGGGGLYYGTNSVTSPRTRLSGPRDCAA